MIWNSGYRFKVVCTHEKPERIRMRGIVGDQKNKERRTKNNNTPNTKKKLNERQQRPNRVAEQWKANIRVTNTQTVGILKYNHSKM